MNIADRIQCLRKNKGLSQEELADKVGVSRQEDLCPVLPGYACE